MKDWFLVERIDPDTFVIREPAHWEQTNSYLLVGKRYALLIDTGLGVSNMGAIVKSLTDLPVLVTTTHVHWDHIGGHRHFENIAVHEAEVRWLKDKFPLSLAQVKQNLTCKPCRFPPDFKLDDYHIFRGSPARLLSDRDRIELGGRTVVVFHTPGHSPGHCCFYEPDRKYLYTGDLIYRGCLDMFYPSTDPELFYQSVRIIRSLDIRRILPGHYSPDLPVSFIESVLSAFSQLLLEDKLKQGNGVFDFGDFQLHL